MIKISIKGTEEFVKKALDLQKAKERIRDRLRKLSEFYAVKTVATSVDKYLSGPRPERLGRVTGRLATSVARGWKVQTVGEKNILIQFGTDVPYAPVHEYGFHGTVQVPAHTRHVSSGDVFKRMKKISQRTGREFTSKSVVSRGSTTVRAHSRMMNIRKRPFLRPAVEANFQFLKDGIMEILRQSSLGTA